MGRLTVFILSCFAIITTLGGCNSSGCIENQSSVPLAGFYSGATMKGVAVDSISIGGVGAPNDSMIVANGQGISQVYLPFRSRDSKTSFFIHYEQEALNYDVLNDTLTFEYSSIPYFVSEECGAMYYYRISRLSYTRHLIDSVGLVDSLINNIDIERIRIYFRMAETEE